MCGQRTRGARHVHGVLVLDLRDHHALGAQLPERDHVVDVRLDLLAPLLLRTIQVKFLGKNLPSTYVVYKFTVHLRLSPSQIYRPSTFKCQLAEGDHVVDVPLDLLTHLLLRSVHHFIFVYSALNG